MKHLGYFFTLFILFSPFPVNAKLFQNSYISFEIPEMWECKAFGTDWVCHSKLQEKKVEALITSTAKIAGINDTREQYLAYLQQEKTWFNVKKEEITSKKMVEAKQVLINRFPWIDSVHKNSEIKFYISRYAGTVCCKDSSSKLGILVVLSAHQDHYKKYSADFVKTVNSLRVLDIEKAISKVRASQASGSSAEMSDYLEGLFDDDSQADLEGIEGEIFGLKPTEWGLLGLVLLSGLAYFMIKRRKGKKSRKRSRSRRKK